MTPMAAGLSGDPKELRQGLCDLAAVSALPAIWADHSAAQIGESLADVLVAILRLEFAFISLRSEGWPPALHIARASNRLDPDAELRIDAAIAQWLTGPPVGRAVTLASPIGNATVRVVFQMIGIGGYGTIAAAASRADFPTAVERLLLAAAANQAAIAIERRQTAEALQQLNNTLEQRVAAEISGRLTLEEAFRQAQKMEAMGQLTAGIAHDFNNLLTAIWGSLEMLERQVTSKSGLRLLQTAIRTAHRGAELTGKLLAFSRKQHLVPEPVDLNGLVTAIRDMLDRAIGPAVTIETALAPDLWQAMVDPSQIELAILNLAINSRDAMPEGGQAIIATRNVPIPPGAGSPDLAVGDYVGISVADTGTGIAPDLLGKVLEPFFTTKDVGKGSGLGLSMVYGMVKQSGGSLRIDSKPGSGTLVELLLPRA